MGNPGGQLAERRHLLGLDQIGLRRLEVTVRGFGGVARGADLGLAALALGDVAVDQHEATFGHRIVAHFDHLPVGARALEAVVAMRALAVAAQLRLGVGALAELAASREIADVVGIARPLRHQRVGQI